MRPLAFDRKDWSRSWENFLGRWSPECGRSDCSRSDGGWRRVCVSRIRMQGRWYCLPDCFERALLESLQRSSWSRSSRAMEHRIPLGLILLERKQLSAEQLRQALEAQRAAGEGKIGEWLERLGFATGSQVLAALARQWSCPVLRREPSAVCGEKIRRIPLLLLESARMIPVEFVERTSTLYVAFDGGIDYSALNALEHMLECRTEACLCGPDTLERHLAQLKAQPRDMEVVFERMADCGDVARIVRSYADRVGALEARVADCQSCLWVRMHRAARPGVNVLFHRDGAHGFETVHSQPALARHVG